MKLTPNRIRICPQITRPMNADGEKAKSVQNHPILAGRDSHLWCASQSGSNFEHCLTGDGADHGRLGCLFAGRLENGIIDRVARFTIMADMGGAFLVR